MSGDGPAAPTGGVGPEAVGVGGADRADLVPDEVGERAAPDAGGDAADDRPPPSRRVLAAIAIPLGVLVVAAQLGDIIWASLVEDHPLLLITLNARNRYLALTTTNLDALSYYVVGSIRLLVSDPLFYLLGYLYGDRAVQWMERRLPTLGDTLRRAEKLFGRAAAPLVFIAPNNYICLFAGAARMRPLVFISLNVSGTIARLVLIRLFAARYESVVDDLLDLIARYRIPILVASALIVAITVISDHRRGGSELEALRHLEEDLGED